MKEKTTRKFLGKTKDFVSNTERNFYKKMLKAYLRGAEYFNYKFERDLTGKIKVDESGVVRARFQVEQRYDVA